MQGSNSFRDRLKAQFDEFIREQERSFPEDETVRVDIHCHDHNSRVPDETLGRMLRLPETWATTEEVFATIRENRSLPLCVTNHNNADTCWELLDRGEDVIVGAELSCTVPDWDLGIHVLAYDFTPAQEARLNELRRNIYDFLEYTVDNDIITVLAHPLFFYKKGELPPFEYLEKLSLMFDNIEAINGQRDARQNLLMAVWLSSLDEERITDISRRVKLSPSAFCRRPFRKTMTGGSDCHMALFAGTAGTLFHVPDLLARKGSLPMSKLVLESFRNGQMAPFGKFVSEEKLTTAFLDYFCQVAMNIGDPGLIRLFLHKGETKQKLFALAILNGMMELRRHSYTTRFLSAFHNAIHGKRPGFLVRRTTKKDYRPLVTALDEIALSRRRGTDAFDQTLQAAIPRMFHSLDKVLAERIMGKLETHGGRIADLSEKPLDIIERLEIPAYLRVLFSSRTEEKDSSFADALDGLPFPALAAFILGGAHFAGARTMYANRPLVDRVAAMVGQYRQPERILWLTDTYYDRNGVSRTLQLLRKEAERRNLPVDFVVVTDREVTERNLVGLAPLAKLTSRYYRGQAIRFADVLELHRIFEAGGYDRVVCSTEGPMGLMALYLKYAFSVPAYFYLHTDWIDFARQTLGFGQQAVDRIRRMLRAYYRLFDGVFVLNREQQEALADPAMGIPKERIFLTAHWVKETFRPRPVLKSRLLPETAPDTPILLFAGRVSEEKGVFQFPEIMERVRRDLPGARLVVCGDGPALERLKGRMPDDLFLGWVDDERLAGIYSAADVMLFPSTFDTFGNVVLEAHACGLPVVAYGVKGPRDIIADHMSGFLVTTPQEMAERAVQIIAQPKLQAVLRKGALERAARFHADRILGRFLEDVGIGPNSPLDFGNPEQLNPAPTVLVG